MRTLIKITTAALLSASFISPLFAQDEVNIYSARKEDLIRPLLDAFTKKTQIEVNIISGKADALLNRIVNEAQNSPVDVLLTTDAGRLWRAKQAGVLATVESDVLNQLIPANLRDTDQQWFGLSVRARPIMLSQFYISNTASEERPHDYSDLADPKHQNQICIRSSDNIYNQSLMASVIANQGEEAALNWANGLVGNMARKPQGGDRDQIKAAALGQCGIAIANTYYLASMLAENSPAADKAAAQAMTILWPNQSTFGAHVNVSGAGVAKHSPNPKNAVALIEFLASDAAQEIYANVNFEYPVRDGIELNSLLQSWGEFKADTLDLSTLGELNPKAVMIMDKAGWR